jgi:hypothetical protein
MTGFDADAPLPAKRRSIGHVGQHEIVLARRQGIWTSASLSAAVL